MAIAVDTQAKGTVSGASATITQSWTVNSASPLVLSCSATGGSINGTAFTWNGVAADFLQFKVDGAVTYGTLVGMWKNPATGTHTAVATFAGNVDGIMFMVSTTGGDTTTGFGTRYTQNDSVTGPNTNLLSVVDSQNGYLVIMAVTVQGNTLAAAAGQTTGTAIQTNILGDNFSGFLSTEPATGGNTTGGSAADVSFYSEVGVALMPGGGPVTLGLSGSASTPGSGLSVPNFQIGL